eukprot:scaffold15686_cov30-Tisochrysis_lutea.AAC.3
MVLMFVYASAKDHPCPHSNGRTIQAFAASDQPTKRRQPAKDVDSRAGRNPPSMETMRPADKRGNLLAFAR